MAIKNINKINSLNLGGFIQRMPKLFVSQRYFTTTNQLRKPPQKKEEPNYTNFLSKNSAISMIIEQTSQKINPYLERRFENEQAAVQLRKCNEILKEHYLKKRTEQEKWRSGEFQRLPTLSKKLRDIMAKDVYRTVTNPPQHDDLKVIHGFKSKHAIMDFKPPNAVNVNRWHMKVPTSRQLVFNEDKSTELDTCILCKRSRKVVKPPGIKDLKNLFATQSKSRQSMFNKERAKIKKMWQIGTRNIPRLD